MTGFFTEASHRRGPRPSRLPFGGYEAQQVVADDLSPTLRRLLSECPDGDFARFGHLKVARIFDSVIRRGFIEPCGYVADGQWQYRLTTYGRAVHEVLAA